MSYQLERELNDRVNRYLHEAEVQRSIPRRSLRSAMAATLRKLADGLDAPQSGRAFPAERSPIALHGRNH